MANKKEPQGEAVRSPDTTASDASELSAEILQRVFFRTGAIVWRANVEVVDAETIVEGQKGSFHWDFHLVSSSAPVREWLGLDDASEEDSVAWSGNFLPEYQEEMHRRARAALLGGENGYEQEFSLRGRDGQVRWMREAVEIQPEGPGRWTLVGVLTDITKNTKAEDVVRRSEAFFRSIWENSTDGIRLTDSEGRILAVNDAFCRLVDMPRERLVNQLFPAAYAATKPLEEMLEGYRKRCRERNFSARHQSRVQLHSGEIRDLDLSFSETDGDGEGPVFLTMMRDVTENRRAEERRLKVERKMLDAQRLESLGILAGGIAHDFNNLLTAILGNASLAMMQMAPSSPLRPFLEGVEKTSLQAADLCKQMLAYSGHGRLEFRSISINTLVEEMNHLLQVSINKQIILRFKLAPSLPPIRAEPSEIQQVIMNLVINASEAIGERSGVITLSSGLIRADRAFLEETFLAPDLPEGDYVFLEVADTGCGMAPETKTRIFDPFFTTKFTGRGLGLAAVLGILQRHKGAFKVYTEPDKGTTFRILIPATGLLPEGDPLVGQHTRRPEWKGSVLVVDDEQSVRAVAARMIESCGLTVLLAKDGGEAVEIFRRHQDELDLVILDMTMPVMGGEEAFRQIRRMKPKAKVLLMSGYTEADTSDRFAGKGLDGFIQKPFKWEQLEDKLKQILGSGIEEEEKA